VDPNIQLTATGFTCVIASGQILDIVGQVKLPLKVEGFSRSWVFLVNRRLKSQRIFRAGFIPRTKMVLERASSGCFLLSPHRYISISFRIQAVHLVQTSSLSSSLPDVQRGKLASWQQKNWKH